MKSPPSLLAIDAGVASLTVATDESPYLDPASVERLLAAPDVQAAWTTEQILRVKLPFKSGGLNPRVYLLRRMGSSE